MSALPSVEGVTGAPVLSGTPPVASRSDPDGSIAFASGAGLYSNEKAGASPSAAGVAGAAATSSASWTLASTAGASACNCFVGIGHTSIGQKLLNNLNVLGKLTARHRIFGKQN